MSDSTTRDSAALCSCGARTEPHPKGETPCVYLAPGQPVYETPATLREQIAREIEAQREQCGHWPVPHGDCWVCQRHGAFTRAARIARGEDA